MNLKSPIYLHAKKRFKERYGYWLSKKNYLDIIEHLKSGQVQPLLETFNFEGRKSKVYKMKWRDVEIYPVLPMNSNEEAAIITFLTSEMVGKYKMQPLVYWTAQEMRRRYGVDY